MTYATRSQQTDTQRIANMTDQIGSILERIAPCDRIVLRTTPRAKSILRIARHMLTTREIFESPEDIWTD